MCLKIPKYGSDTAAPEKPHAPIHGEKKASKWKYSNSMLRLKAVFKPMELACQNTRITTAIKPPRSIISLFPTLCTAHRRIPYKHYTPLTIFRIVVLVIDDVVTQDFKTRQDTANDIVLQGLKER